MRNGDVLGMVANGEVVIPFALGGQGHLLNREMAVAGFGMHMQIATDILEPDEVGEGMVETGFHFTPILS